MIPKEHFKATQRIDIEIGEINKGDMIDYIDPKNPLWRGYATVHTVKKMKMVLKDATDTHIHITFKHVRGIYKRNKDDTAWLKYKEWKKPNKTGYTGNNFETWEEGK